MEPTIKVNDRLLAFKLAYSLRLPYFETTLWQWRRPVRGDIVVFQYPKDPSINYVKRVVAVAGDRIRLRDRVLEINGIPQAQSVAIGHGDLLSDIESPQSKVLLREDFETKWHWILHDLPTANAFPNENFPADGSEREIPEGNIFVLGDNRDASKDSRDWGHVPLEYVKSQAILVLWGIYDPQTGGVLSLRLRRFLHILR